MAFSVAWHRQEKYHGAAMMQHNAANPEDLPPLARQRSRRSGKISGRWAVNCNASPPRGNGHINRPPKSPGTRVSHIAGYRMEEHVRAPMVLY